jgi:type II secretory pathway component PulF
MHSAFGGGGRWSDRGSLIPELLTNVVATGEASGRLDEVLRSINCFLL